MTRAGLPVPPGFTITTEACNAFYAGGGKYPEGLWEQVEKSLRVVEKTTGKGFGDPRNPLLVSVRSGAKFSMPGMTDTVLNLGLNAKTLEGLASLTKDRRFALDAQRRFIQLFSKIVLGIDGQLFEDALGAMKQRKKAKTDADLTTPALEELIVEYRAIVTRPSRSGFPEDPVEQLRAAIGAVFESWNNKRAIDYRNYNRIPHDLGTAVNVQSMVFGNMGDDSGTGVAFTRDPSTGEKQLFGEYLLNAQGEDVVAGIRTPSKIDRLEQDLPHVYQQFQEIAQRLEQHYHDMQDLEFTVEKGHLYMLQTRSGKRNAQAAVKIAVDMVAEGLISEQEAVKRVDPGLVSILLLPRFDDEDKKKATKEGRLLAKGLNASPGAASGKAIFSADEAEKLGKAGTPVVLVRPETSPDDVHGMLVAKGVLTARGGATSHAAVVARGLGLPCVAGCEALVIDMRTRTATISGKAFKEGDSITIDGTNGVVIGGALKLIDPPSEWPPWRRAFLSW